MAQKRAVILLSGGLDSATTAAIAKQQGFDLYALSVDYGQRHRFELTAAERVAAALGVVRQTTVTVDLSQFGNSALTSALEVPKGRSADAMQQGIPITYVPARNTVLLSLALGYAETLKAADIFLGVNAVDYSGYPDCRPEFIRSVRAAGEPGDQGRRRRDARFKIHAPLIELTKAEIIRRGVELGVDYSPDAQLLRSRRRTAAVRPVRRLPVAAQRLCRGRAERSDRICTSLT